ncbi:MAG: hypothetical protein AB1547_05895 [Thermodesulfobacteriota bacterium]
MTDLIVPPDDPPPFPEGSFKRRGAPSAAWIRSANKTRCDEFDTIFPMLHEAAPSAYVSFEDRGIQPFSADPTEPDQT